MTITKSPSGGTASRHEARTQESLARGTVSRNGGCLDGLKPNLAGKHCASTDKIGQLTTVTHDDNERALRTLPAVLRPDRTSEINCSTVHLKAEGLLTNSAVIHLMCQR
jgi:hypothetical protein